MIGIMPIGLPPLWMQLVVCCEGESCLDVRLPCGRGPRQIWVRQFPTYGIET